MAHIWILLLSWTCKGISTPCTWKDDACEHPASDPEGQRWDHFSGKLHVFKKAALIMWPGFLMRGNNLVENILKMQLLNKSQHLKAVTNRSCCAAFLSRITCWLGQMFSSRAEWRFWKCLRVISTITAVIYKEKLICKYYLSLKLEK